MTTLSGLKQHWGPTVASWLPLDLWQRLTDVEVLLPYYHLVGDHEVSHVSALYKFRSVRQFKADIAFFLRNYTPVSLQDIIDHLDGVRRLPKRCFFLTFDDGFREVHDTIAPLLYAQGIPAAFFIITSVVDNRELCHPQKRSLLLHALAQNENPATVHEISRRLAVAGIAGSDLPAQIRSIPYAQRHLLDELGVLLGCDFTQYAASVRPYLTSVQIASLLRQGFAVGAHSVDHPRYAELNPEAQLAQTRDSLMFLASQFGCECCSFAFPYTDSGVAEGFFHNAFSDGRLKISFGGEGMRRHTAFPRHLARFSMEKTDLPAQQILARQFGRLVLHKD